MWEHELNDWRWALGVNVWGVIHGINAFVPAMLDGGDEGHVVNTSSGNGGISPLPTTPQYARHQGGGRHAHRVPLRPAAPTPAPQVGGVGAVPRAAHAAHRPVRVVAQPARPSSPTRAPRRRRTPRSRRSRSRCRPPASSSTTRRSRRSPPRSSTPSAPSSSGSCPPSERTDEQIRARAESMLARTNPDLHPRPRSLTMTHGPLPRHLRRTATPACPNEQYRDWLDPEYRDAFDDVPRRAARRMLELAAARASSTRSSPRSGSEENEEGLRGGWDAGPARQGARRRRRGRRGDLPRRRRGRPPARRRRSAPGSASSGDTPTRAAAGRRPGPQPVARRAVRRQPRAPRRRGDRADHRRLDAAVAEIRRATRVGPAGRHPDPVDVGSRRAVPRRRVRPGVGGVRGAGDAGARALRRRRPRGVRRRTSASTSPRCAGGRPGRCGSCSGRACSSASPACASSSPSAARSGPPTCCG